MGFVSLCYVGMLHTRVSLSISTISKQLAAFHQIWYTDTGLNCVNILCFTLVVRQKNIIVNVKVKGKSSGAVALYSLAEKADEREQQIPSYGEIHWTDKSPWEQTPQGMRTEQQSSQVCCLWCFAPCEAGNPQSLWDCLAGNVDFGDGSCLGQRKVLL